MKALSREGAVIAALVVPSILFAVWLVHGLHRPKAKVGLSPAEQMVKLVLDNAERKASAAKAHWDEIFENFNAVIRPGPEPEWYHPIDHLEWEEKAVAWNKLRDNYLRERAEVARVKFEADEEVYRLKQDIAKMSVSPEVSRTAKDAWLRYAVPPLHVWLAFSLVRFSARSVFRFLLLKDKIGAIRL